jgi:hypothetical protein
MTDAERRKVLRLKELFARSKELDKEAATHLVIMVDHMLEALARGNTRSVEQGLVMLRSVLSDQAGG